ncbi:MAG: AAA family ATPase [Ktedonobacteraceae bacterium]|nr:AAA family ATPase [Ktedonobacteraceae bacterium]
MEEAWAAPGSSLVLPARSLLVLCGPAGAGKSTFARNLVNAHRDQGLSDTMIVSSDYCRALVCDDETNQLVSRDAFDLFHYIIHKRMLNGRFTIADSTALHAEARRRILGLVRQHNYYACILVFNPSPERIARQDQARERIVGEQVITYHADLLTQALQAIPSEGWNEAYMLNDQHLDAYIGIRLQQKA